MKLEGNKIILDAGESVTIEVREKDVQPAPAEGRMTLQELLDCFNPILVSRGYKVVAEGMAVRNYLGWACGLAQRYYDGDEWMFRAENYCLVFDYRGKDTGGSKTAYNGMQAWLIASILSELVPDSGATTNTQTELFRKAYEIGGGRSYPLYNRNAFKADPYAMREAASVMYAICRGDSNIASQIGKYRSELGGKLIPASSWDGLGYKNTMLTDERGRRGYRMDHLGYCVNTELFLPDAPAPRVLGTTVCEMPWPWEQGQPKDQFSQATGNYIVDEQINNFFVSFYNMMSQTPLSEWEEYSLDKKCRMINVGAVPPCTFTYWFCKKNIMFDGIRHKAYGTNPGHDYYCFSEVSENTGLALEGPFSDLQGIYRYNTMGDRERCLDTIATIFDNFRFPTEDPNYGRCRPGCKVSRTVESVNPTPGAPENEVYNVDLCVMVSDDEAGKKKRQGQDGFASDSPRSYVSGHSAQIWGMALMLTQMNSSGNCREWVSKAFDYSVNRSIGRYHWNSDCVYGRLFGALALPIINAMSGLNLDPIKNYVLNPTPQPAPTGNWGAKVIIKNQTGKDIPSTGQVRLYVAGHIGVNVYMPNAVSLGKAVTIPPGEYAYDATCVGNGFEINDSYDGKTLEEGRVYDERHYNNKDWTPPTNVVIDTGDKRCSPVLRKAGATYVLRVFSK